MLKLQFWFIKLHAFRIVFIPLNVNIVVREKILLISSTQQLNVQLRFFKNDSVNWENQVWSFNTFGAKQEAPLAGVKPDFRSKASMGLRHRQDAQSWLKIHWLYEDKSYVIISKVFYINNFIRCEKKNHTTTCCYLFQQNKNKTILY